MITRVMRIKELREQAGLTQTTFGSRVGVSQTVVSEWEKEVYLPRARQMPLVAHVLGVTINDLYNPAYLNSVS